MIILGISCFYHDSSVCLVKDGDIISAVQEERFSRVKNDSQFPSNSIKFCLFNSNITLDDVDYIVFYEKPFLKFERLLETHISFAPKGFKSFLLSMPVWLKEKLFQKKTLVDKLIKYGSKPANSVKSRILFCDHHLSHASSAFYPSGFDEALVIVLDGVGEWTSTSIWCAQNSKLELKKKIDFPHSIGLLYSAFTQYLGFKVNSDEYKVMGLAPYGEPKYSDLIESHLLDLKEDGSYHLNMRFFNYCVGDTMINDTFEKLFQHPTRKESSSLTSFHADIACSIQKVTEKVVLRIVDEGLKTVDTNNICLAGGVALNCVINGKIALKYPSKKIWIQPAAGDAGGALGAALYAHRKLATPLPPKVVEGDFMKGALLGPAFQASSIRSFLLEKRIEFEEYDSFTVLSNYIADQIQQGKVVGWFQGKMEFGPRALGNRSILADPRNATMQRDLNLKIKFRESFRPFAPAILEEYTAEYFSYSGKSPYMLMVSEVLQEKRVPSEGETVSISIEQKLKKIRSIIPAVTHVDYTARVQSVSKETNPRFHELITAFHRLTKCPILLNTSFNVKDEPIVCDLKDAYACFQATGMDILVLENFVVIK